MTFTSTSLSVAPRRFAFAFDPAYRMASIMFGVTPNRAWVQVGGEHLEVSFGPWRVRTPLDNLVGVQTSGDYQWFKTMGPARLSLADHGLTFATNRNQGVCIRFAEPVAGIDPMGTIRHPGLTVTVADPRGLVDALRQVLPVRNPSER